MKQFVPIVWMVLLFSFINIYSMHYALKQCIQRSHLVNVSHIQPQRSNRTYNIIEETASLFNKVPGYDKLINKFHTALQGRLSHTAKGQLYELEVAFDLYKHGHEIKAFEIFYTDEQSGYAREIDIVTDQCAVECKDIQWNYLLGSPKVRQRFERQLYEQYTIVASGAVGAEVHYFIFYSKQPIPSWQKKWLKEQHIFYMQGPY